MEVEGGEEREEPVWIDKIARITDIDKLRAIFEDENASPGDRDRAFYVYWLRRANSAGKIVRSDLEEIVSYAHTWPDAATSLPGRFAIRGRIEPADAAWLVAGMDRNNWIRRQLLALVAISEEGASSLAKVETALDLHAPWAANKVVASAPADELRAIRDRLMAGDVPRGSRAMLLITLDTREQLLNPPVRRRRRNRSAAPGSTSIAEDSRE